jgi:hypothetical protein
MIVLRATKGSALTWEENDGNFIDLDTRLTELGEASNPIDSITVVGNQMTITYNTAMGGGSDVVTIPTASWRFTGGWQPSHSYAVNDVFSFGPRLYVVVVAHTSDTSFDPGKHVSGQSVYQCLLAATGEMATVTLSATAYTVGANDSMTYFRCTATAGCVVTIAPNATVAVPLDSEIRFRQCASGAVSFIAGSGVTLNIPTGATAATTKIGDVAFLKQVATDVWDLVP